MIVTVSCASITETYIDHNPYKIRKRINPHKKQDAKRHEQIKNCAKTWTFYDLDSTIDLTVIQYHAAYRFSLNSQPTLLSGLTNQDTVRILCYNYFDKLVKEQKTKVIPDSTMNMNSINLQNLNLMGLVYQELPLFLSKNKNEDRYFRDIKNILWESNKIKTGYNTRLLSSRFQTQAHDHSR